MWPGPLALQPELRTWYTDSGENREPNFTDSGLDFLPPAVLPSCCLSCPPGDGAQAAVIRLSGVPATALLFACTLGTRQRAHQCTDLGMCPKFQGNGPKVPWFSASISIIDAHYIHVFWKRTFGAQEVLLMTFGLTEITQRELARWELFSLAWFPCWVFTLNLVLPDVLTSYFGVWVGVTPPESVRPQTLKRQNEKTCLIHFIWKIVFSAILYFIARLTNGKPLPLSPKEHPNLEKVL